MKKFLKKNIKLFIGIIISIICLYYSMKGVKFNELIDSFKKISIFYLILSILTFYLQLVFRTLRWQVLLEKIKKTHFKTMFSTLSISLMMLLILPARLGEFARAYVVGKKEKISKSASFSTIVIERIFDGCSTILLFLCAVFISPKTSSLYFPEFNVNSKFKMMLFKPFATVNIINDNTYEILFSVISLIYFVAFFYLCAIIFVIILKIFGRHALLIINKIIFFLPEHLKHTINETLESFIEGLNCLDSIKKFVIVTLYSFATWISQGILIYFILKGFNFDFPIYFSFIILGFTILGVMIPAAPGFIGTYHLMINLAFQYYLPDYNKSLIVAFSWVTWAVGTLICIFTGFYFFKKENLHLKNIKKETSDIS